MSELRIESVPKRFVKNFKIRCIMANRTMREGIVWCMKQVGDGKIIMPDKPRVVLPEKKVKKEEEL